MLKEFVHTTRFVHELYLLQHVRQPGRTQRSGLEAQTAVHPIRNALGQGLIAIGQRLVGRDPVKPLDEAA